MTSGDQKGHFFRDMILDQFFFVAGYLLQTYDFASSPCLVLKGGGTLAKGTTMGTHNLHF